MRARSTGGYDWTDPDDMDPPASPEPTPGLREALQPFFDDGPLRETGAPMLAEYIAAHSAQFRAALDAAPAPEPPFWLIERGQPEKQSPTVWWWLEPGGREGWTADALRAFRFDSRDAAEEIIAAKFTPPSSRGEPSARAVEHAWIAAPEPTVTLTFLGNVTIEHPAAAPDDREGSGG